MKKELTLVSLIMAAMCIGMLGNADPSSQSSLMGNVSATNSIELVLWYIRTNSASERTRLLTRDALPANDKPYMEIAVPRQETSLISDAGEPLVDGHAEHRVVLYPDHGEIRGYDTESWLGFLPSGVSVSNATVRIWCASAGSTRLVATLKQYDAGAMAEGDVDAIRQPAWEGIGECEVATNIPTLFTIALVRKPSTNFTPYSEKQMLALLIKAAAGEPCMLSTGNRGKNQALPFIKLLSGLEELTLFRREGVTVASDAPAVQAVLDIDPGPLSPRKAGQQGYHGVPSLPQALNSPAILSRPTSEGPPAGDRRSLPAFQESLLGRNEIRVRNPNNFAVQAGIRSGSRGVDLNVPANGVKSVYIGNGRFDIYFIYSDRPTALFQGDSFTLADNGVEIQIVKIINGNYNIREVR